MKQILFMLIIGLSIFVKPAQAINQAVQVDFSTPSGMIASQDYILPYPGILLDHPLYMFKNLRDAAMEFLITDPVKKHEFAILQTDKFLGMAIKYAEMGKWDYVETALTRSKNAANTSVTGFLQPANDPVRYPLHIKDRLVKSLTKQAEVVEGFSQKAPETSGQFIIDHLKAIQNWRDSLLAQK